MFICNFPSWQTHQSEHVLILQLCTKNQIIFVNILVPLIAIITNDAKRNRSGEKETIRFIGFYISQYNILVFIRVL